MTRKSKLVMLVLSGSLLQACDTSPPKPQVSQPMTNNAYVPGLGYYHAYYHDFYPYPVNHFIPGQGYYYGGSFRSAPGNVSIASSVPKSTARVGGVSTSRGIFGGSASVSS